MWIMASRIIEIFSQIVIATAVGAVTLSSVSAILIVVGNYIWLYCHIHLLNYLQSTHL